MALLILAATLLTQISWSSVAATMYTVTAYYSGTDCSGTPYGVVGWEDPTCTEDVEPICEAYDGSADSVGVEQTYLECSLDYVSTIREIFSRSTYILEAIFNDSDCSSLLGIYGVPATGNCEGSFNNETSYYIKGSVNASGATIEYFSDVHCLEPLYDTEHTDPTTLAEHSCDANHYKWYSSNDKLESSTSGSAPQESNISGSTSQETVSTNIGTGAVVGIICGCIVVVVIIVGVILYRRRSKDKHRGHYTTTLDASSLEAALSGQTGLWNDDVITAKRIPRDKVKIKKLISRGAYGEVYNGVFNGQPVAVKMLLPSTRGSLQHVTDFLTEAKMTASMDHPHIVTFIGVAWDSLSDLCVVLEFMDGGDLRMLLNKYEATKHPVGFDKQKTTIALHVCHALTYLHSLMPPVIHRDLKSRNILLNHDFEAKLTDFGISRERLDQTMTAGVGTSLWMAPEVMLGEKYDVKADMFSFGVVLSELDVHTLPYAQAKQRSLDTSGRKMADATLLQKITAGEIQVDFSESSPRSLVDLGLACVAIDSNDRPTAAEALYRLQVILAQELAG